MAGDGGETTKVTKSWSAIAKMNTSNRNQTNTLEVRLENDENKGWTLNCEEIERLLKRLMLVTTK